MQSLNSLNNLNALGVSSVADRSFLKQFPLGADGMAFSSRNLTKPKTDVVRGLLTGASIETDSKDFLGSVVSKDIQALYNNAMYFDGANDYIDCGIINDFSESEITFGGYITANNFEDFNNLFGNRSGGSGAFVYSLSSGKLRPHVSASGFKSFDTVTELDLNTRYHIVMTAKQNGTLRLYINGVADTNTVSMGSASFSINGYTFRIGDDGSVSNFNGIIEGVRTYNTELTASQVEDWYNGNPPSGAIHYWIGSDNTNAGWIDQEGSNNGTVNGSPALFTGQGFSGTAPIWYDQSVLMNDRRFYGNEVDSYAVSDSAVLPATDDFTFDFELYIPTSYTPDISNEFYWEQATATGSLTGFALGNNGDLRLFNISAAKIIQTSSFSRDQWIEIKVTRTSGIFELFVEGVSVGTYDLSGSSIEQSTFNIGGSSFLSGGRHSLGGIKNIKLNGELLYTCQVVDGKILDQTGGGNDLTVSGSPYAISDKTGKLALDLSQTTAGDQLDIVTDGVTTKIGNLDALVSDGSELMTIDHNIVNDPTTYLMVSCVVTATTNGYFIAKYDTTSGRTWGLRVTSNNLVVAFGNPADGSFAGTYDSSSTFDFTSPIVVGFVFNAGTCTLYVNSVEESGGGVVPASLYSSDVDISLMSRLNGGNLAEGLTGEIAEVIYTTDSSIDIVKLQKNQMKAANIT